MEDQQNQQTEQQTAYANKPGAQSANETTGAKTLERITAIILITTGIFFAVISVLAIWGLLGDSGELIVRTLGTLGVVALTAIIINVGARMMESRKK